MTVRTGEIELERLDGRCYVRYLRERAEIEEWVKHDDHFYLNQKGNTQHGLFVIHDEDLDHCEVCQEARNDDIVRAQELFNQNGPLRGLELFSGKYLVVSLGGRADMQCLPDRCWWVGNRYRYVGIR